jgi:ring-1,2-phenylacetyl-CoA epoxidase subunit PaaD
MGAAVGTSVADAWAVLHTVPDPEVPVLSVCDLGLVRDVLLQGGHLHVVLTPTYSGCPATEVIAHNVKTALQEAGFSNVQVSHRLAPAWTSDWISDEGRHKLREYGIAPPACVGAAGGISESAQLAASPVFVSPIQIRPKNVACPRCDSLNTERLAAFGSTACKALHRCLACLEPFEHFKPI